MNISYKWLKRYIDFSATPRELASILTSLGLECDNVEEVETIRGGLRGLVTGRVLTCVDHPDSDHLHITTVDLGDGAPTQIVCGAPNVAAGQNVIVATVGTTLYDGDKEIKIKKSKIRGVESFGMICAEDEIGIGSSHEGIMVLPSDVKPGTPAAEYFNVENDYRLEVELTPNRVDASSHYGVARDLKAYLWRHAEGGTPLPEATKPDVSGFAPDSKDGAAATEVIDTEGCIRYSGVTVRGVKVEESPEWLRNLLTAAGQRPINNIVDITNFILLGIGQPLHCFDLSKVKGEKIEVRTVAPGTSFTTLDGVERKLDGSDLMICDTEKPLCIAGVFGGIDSGVTETTTDIFIESACFNPTRVRRTARRHGLSTDASFRYERGTDPNITIYAAKLAALLVKELAGGEICGDVSDIYPHPVKDAEFDFSRTYCNRLIGKEIDAEMMRKILSSLEIEITDTSDTDCWHLKVPAYRVDVTRPCDVVEEILRVYGYNNVEFDMEMHATLSQKGLTDFSYSLQELIGNSLSAAGFNEIMNNSLSSANYYPEDSELSGKNCVKILNPLSGDLSMMRRTLLFGGLESISHNINRKHADLAFYEFGNVYEFDPEKESTAEHPLAPYSEHPELGIWMTGKKATASWNSVPADYDVFDLKAVVYGILEKAGIPAESIKEEQSADEFFAAKLTVSTRSGKNLAVLGVLRTDLLKKFDIDQPVVYAAVEWKNLVKLASRNKVTFSNIAKTHPVKRDLALLIDKGIPFAAIEEIVRKSERKLLRDVQLFDVYEGKNLPEGKKSYAIALTLQDDEKTLNDKQIDAVMKKIIANLEKEAGAQLR